MRAHLIAAVLVLSCGLAAPAVAAEQAAYSPAALAKAQMAGKPVVLHVEASWCSTCAAQKPIVRSILKDPRFKDLVVLDVDFDKQKAVLRKLNVREQSTFVVYKGQKELGRSTGDTDKASIEALFGKAAS